MQGLTNQLWRRQEWKQCKKTGWCHAGGNVGFSMDGGLLFINGGIETVGKLTEMSTFPSNVIGTLVFASACPYLCCYILHRLIEVIDMQIWSSIPFWCILTWLLTWVQTMTNWQWANWQTMNAAHHVRQWQSSLLRHLWGVANMKGCIEYSYFVIKHILWVKKVGIQLTQPPLQIDRLTWRPCCARVMILNTDNCWPQLCRGRYS